MFSVEEAIKEIENYLDYEGSVSIQALATLYTSYNKEKEKNKELEKQNKILKEEKIKLETELQELLNDNHIPHID